MTKLRLIADGPLREGVLARTRAVLALSALIAIRIDPTEPARYADLAYGLLVAYAAWGILLVAAVRTERLRGRAFALAAHGMDVAWAGALSLFTDGPNSPFFIFFAFVLAAAAYRWGMSGALATSAVLTAILLAEAVVVGGLGRPGAALMEGDFDTNRLVMRAVYLVIIGYLFGHLAERERRLQRETAALAQVLASLRTERGVKATLQAVSRVLLDHFRAGGVFLALKDLDSGRAYGFGARRGSGEPAFAACEIPAARQALYLLVDSAPRDFALHARRRGAVEVDIVLPAEQRAVLQQALDPLPPELDSPWRSLLVASASLGGEWSGRVFVLDPSVRGQPADLLRALQRLLAEVGPAVDNIYLTRRWRERAAGLERARVARELHDGVLQGLIGLEMQVDVLRRQAIERESGNAGVLTHIQANLRYEILSVRELMQQMAPAEDIGPTEVLDHLSAIVDKFHRESGIGARFVCDLERLSMPPLVCREIVKIVQEALINVRRHSAASNVLVRLTRGQRGWLLVVDDDGRGFEFEGRLSQQELDSSRKGPIVIKERVRSLGGDLVVESHPRQGSRLEITLPEDVVA